MKAGAPLARLLAGNSRLTSTTARREKLAIGFLLIVAVAIYLPSSLAGHPIVPGDDLTQNFPLRVLSGAILRSGRLPAWDPFIWSGTPLLAGWNAGAMFPGTWLFAFLPAIAAWTINLIAVPFIASSGLYTLMRKLGCASAAAVLGALVFTYTGFMSGQVVHLGLVEGTACMPWMLVGVEGLTRSRTRTKSAAYAVLLAVSIALNILAADPRAVSSAAIAVLVYLLASALRARRDAVVLIVRTACATVLGLSLAAIQWLPGLGFLHSSQRSTNVFDFFGGGSIGPVHLATLLTVPFLLGANGNFGLPGYQGSYNLPELTVGVGFIGLVAALCYLPEVLSSFLAWTRWPRFRSRLARSSHRLGVWYALCVVGVILTLGNTTPAAHLLLHIPFYGGERLQNRNAVLFDLALSVLVALFVDDLIGRPRSATAPRFASYPINARLNRWLGLLPMLGAVALISVAYAAPLRVERDLNVLHLDAQLFDVYRGYLIATLVLAGAGLALLFFAPRLSYRTGRIILIGLVLADVGSYLGLGDYASVPSNVLANSNTLSSAVRAYSGPNGRFAIYNPALQLNNPGTPVLFDAGISDLNILQQNPSVQGYGSIVNGIYEDATDTHGYEDLNAARLSGVSFDTLDLRALLSLPEYFGETLATGQAIPESNGEVIDPHGSLVRPASAPPLPPNASGPWTINAGHSVTWTLPSPRNLARADVVLLGRLGAQSALVVTATNQGKSRRFEVPIVDHLAVLSFPSAGGETLSSLTVKNSVSGSIEVGGVVVVTKDPATRLLLDGALQGALPVPHWRYAGTLGPLEVYLNSETAGLAWLQPARDTTPNAGDRTSGTVVVQSSPAQGQRMLVDSPADAVLARSEGYSQGWSARLAPLSGGPTRVLPVHRFGLIQSIDMPQGRYEVTWTYAPRDIRIGFLVTIIGFLALAGLAAFVCVKRAWRAM